MEADLAQLADVETALLRPLTASEALYVGPSLILATALLRARVPDVDDRVSAWLAGDTRAGLNPVLVASVVAQVVARALRNPGGVSSRSETTGPFARVDSFRDPAGRVMAGIYLDAADLEPLNLTAGPVPRARTLRVGLGSFAPCRPGHGDGR